MQDVREDWFVYSRCQNWAKALPDQTRLRLERMGRRGFQAATDAVFPLPEWRYHGAFGCVAKTW